MFGFLKRDPVARLKKRYAVLMAEATELQRQGDIRAFAFKTEEAEKVAAELTRLESEKGGPGG